MGASSASLAQAPEHVIRRLWDYSQLKRAKQKTEQNGVDKYRTRAVAEYLKKTIH